MKNNQHQSPNLLLGLSVNNMVAVPRLGNVQLRLHFLRLGTSRPLDLNKWNFHYGIYAGGLSVLSNNRFFDLNYAASGQVGRFETNLQGNYFYNNPVSSRFFALEPLSGTILPFKMSCNIYDFDRVNNTSQTFRGLVFSGAVNVPSITGTYDLPIITEDPSGNVFPTKHSNRELLPYNLITDDEVDVNSTNSTTSSQHWESPDNWVSITNYTQSLTNPAVPNNTIYHRFKNEFIGRTLPDHFQPNSAIALAAVSPNRYAYTSANDPTNLEGDQYVKVCDNSDAANIISFPTVSAFVNKPKTPELGKDKPIISQSEQAKEITLGTQQNQVIEAYQLIDASGKLVRASESKSASITLSSNGLPTGFYSVILKTEKSVLTSKLVIQ